MARRGDVTWDHGEVIDWREGGYGGQGAELRRWADLSGNGVVVMSMVEVVTVEHISA